MKKKAGWIVFALLAVALSFGGAQRGGQPFSQPDLIVTGIDFQKVQSGKDAQGKTYWIFNVTAKIKNQGNGNAGAFKVQIERNNGAGGAWQTACQTCTIDVAGLAAGQEMTTAARQFNNAMGAPSKFKFKADSAGQVGESNELNNSREEGFISLQIGEIGPGGAGSILKPDLDVVSVEFQGVSESVVNGKTIRTFTVAVKVKNNGPGGSTACKLAIDRGSDLHATVPFQYKAIPPLAASAEITIYSDPVSHEMGTPGKYYHCYADSDKTVDETNEENNGHGYLLYPPSEPFGTAVPAPPRPQLR